MSEPLDADHATERRTGGDRLWKSERLYLIQVVAERGDADIVITSRVPKTRGECPTQRPCDHLRCAHNLSRVTPADRPGRRNVDVDGVVHGPIGMTFEFPVDATSNCAADFIEDGPMSCSEIAKELGTSKRRIQQVARGALLKLKAAGVDVSMFLALLDEERHGRGRTHSTDGHDGPM